MIEQTMNLIDRIWGEKSLEDIGRRCASHGARLSKQCAEYKICYTWLKQRFCKYQGDKTVDLDNKGAQIYYKCMK